MLRVTILYDLPLNCRGNPSPPKTVAPVDKLQGTIHNFTQIQRKEVPSGQKTGSMKVLVHRVGELVDILAECSVDACIIARDLALGHLQGKIQNLIIYIFFSMLRYAMEFCTKILFLHWSAQVVWIYCVYLLGKLFAVCPTPHKYCTLRRYAETDNHGLWIA